jgi:Protein of unknown function (DUF3570)
MQLKPRPLRETRRAWLVLALATFLVTVARSRPARGASDADAPDRTSSGAADTTNKSTRTIDASGATLEDQTTKRAAMEFATYNDSDHVTVVTPSIALGIENTSGTSLHATYLIDIVSAASVDIVSTASSRWKEVRHAGTLEADYKPHDFGVGVGASVSSEPDYQSFAAHATVTKDFDEKNWTLFFGYGFSRDTIGRCGDYGQCTPFSVFSHTLDRGSFNGGIDFVVDRRSLASITGDVIIENGDQSKPYRYVPMFSPEVAPLMPKGASIDLVNRVRLDEKPAEQLPLSRRRLAVTGRYAHRLDSSTLRLEERLYDDSWGLIASTSDVRWIFDLGRRFAIWPHARFHLQNAVTFWQRAYVSESSSGWNLPEYRTGDRELGPLWTSEGGFGIRWYLGGDAQPEQWALQLTGDAVYTAFLDDLFITSRTAVLGALALEGQF